MNVALALVDVALLAWAGWVAVTTLNRRIRPALGLVLVAILASAVPFYLGAGDASVLRFAAAVVAAATARRQRGWSKEEAPDLYPGLEHSRAWEPLVVGALAGLVVAGHPAYLPLGIGLVLLSEGSRRRLVAAAAMVAAGVATSLAPAPVGGGWQAALGHVDLSPGVETLWAGLEFDLGRSFGVLPYFVPVLLLIALHRFRGPGAAVLWGAIASCAVLLIGWPFDWLGDVSRPGNGWFLPLYGALLLIPAQAPRSWHLAVVTALAAIFLAPHWWGLLPGVESSGVRQPTPVSRFLPIETTPRAASGQRLSAGRISAWSPDLDVDRGAWIVVGSRWATLVISSAQPVEKVWLDCGGQAGSDIEIQGASEGETMFRADGGVGFALGLRPSRRHQTAHSDAPVYVHTLRFRLPSAPEAPIRVQLVEDVGVSSGVAR